ncbi:TetR/AcrR family transcriptional regulator C-terminal domain-containing protein [Rhodococcus sp. NPDC079359]|uniref:TetR/AcrR family transcriptional regulator n=1 Tax=Rhodococcus sp. NPDC079359 TaxID=3154961 RepID=UPI003450B933
MPRSRTNRQSLPDKLPISRDMVIDTALRQVDESGVEKLTMRGVADALGVYPTTLYWHAGTKADLLAAVCERLLDGLELPILSEAAEWDSWLLTVCNSVRDGLREHPNVVPLMASQVQVSPSSFTLAEGILGALSAAGFEGDRLIEMYNTVVGFVFGWIFSELAALPSNAQQGWEDRFIEQLVTADADRFPHLRENIDKLKDRTFMLRTVSGRTAPMDSSFATALDLLVSGIRVKSKSVRQQSKSGSTNAETDKRR